jgi:hypothetical protein
MSLTEDARGAQQQLAAVSLRLVGLSFSAQQLLDLLAGIDATGTGSWTLLHHLLPGLVGFEILMPEGIGLALRRTNRIDAAAAIPEDALEVRFFDQTAPTPHRSKIFLLEGRRSHLKESCQFGDVRGVDPHITLDPAALAALRALEWQAVMPPLILHLAPFVVAR